MRHLRHGLPAGGADRLPAALIGLALLLGACAGEAPTAADPTFAEIRDGILLPSCGFSSCHGGGVGDLTIDAAGAREALVDVPSAAAPDEILVIPSDPDGSYLVKKLEGAPDIVGDPMPQGGALAPDDLAAIRAWIARGAPAD